MSPGLARSESFDWDITTDVAMTSAMHSLSYLRIHHEVVTRDYTQQASEFEKVSPRGEGPTYTREITLPVSRRMQSPEHGRGVEQDSSIISPAGESEVRRRSYSGIRRQREAIVHLERTHSRRLTPGMLPTLRTLVLTGIPSFAATANIAQRLINFISLCAEHAYLAAQEAQVAYALPPGRSRHHAERDYAISLFALERIILEVSQQDKVSVEQSRSALLRSSTEDADSEAFWLAAESDFSFFRAEDDGSPEFGTPQRAPLGAQRSLAAEEKLRLSFNDEQSATPSYLGSDVKVDVVKMISDFRRARKLASDTAQSEGLSGESLTFVPGYWQGGIKVLREP
ncbi:MAG: hypothetical protein M1828_005494 [Chrysothrix sp. TS-e1954]|nr:MAG: hypothetical protein M1828_005494 [Chrysothrix sp. TS-e1954]